MKLVLAQCTNEKRDERAVAANLYDESNYFRAQRHYARTADKWAIQSAEYGLLWPHEEVLPYDKHAKDIEDPDAWAEEIVADLVEEVPSEATVEVLGGAAYADPLTPELEAWGYEVHEPLRGLQIGKRKAELARLTRAAKNEVIA